MAKDPKTLSDRDAFRREAALAILSAFISRHGGFAADAQEGTLRRIWEYADAFVDMEHAAPAAPAAPASDRPRGRAAAPDDEWGVALGEHRRRGFATRQEAEEYAAGRPGSEVVQISGPEVTRQRVVTA